MTRVLWIPTCLLVFQATHSYILLTANLEDFQNIGRKLIHLPISKQVKQIARRAYDVFNNQLVKMRAKARVYEDEDNQETRRMEPGLSHLQRKEKPIENSTNLVENNSIENTDSTKEVRTHSEEKISNRDGNVMEDFVSLGRNASFYLNKIKKIFENA